MHRLCPARLPFAARQGLPLPGPRFCLTLLAVLGSLGYQRAQPPEGSPNERSEAGQARRGEK